MKPRAHAGKCVNHDRPPLWSLLPSHYYPYNGPTNTPQRLQPHPTAGGQLQPLGAVCGTLHPISPSLLALFHPAPPVRAPAGLSHWQQMKSQFYNTGQSFRSLTVFFYHVFRG
uniref:Uncharacterized protein n=1 Tax=Eutreptiella gymnastica TaxID=73025 RepID=A0A7S1N8H4_9EUGL